jgi:hypothetical protein
MDRIKREGLFFCFCTGLLLGGLIGILIFNTLVSYRINQYHQIIQNMQSMIEDKDIRLKKLEDALNKNRIVVKDFEINLEYVDNEDDEIVTISLQKHIKEKLGRFIGYEVDKIDPDMLWEVIDKRIMKLEDKEYNLKVTKLVITETIHMTVQVD